MISVDECEFVCLVGFKLTCYAILRRISNMTFSSFVLNCFFLKKSLPFKRACSGPRSRNDDVALITA